MSCSPASRTPTWLVLSLLLLGFSLSAGPDASALPGLGSLKKSAEKEAAKAAGVSDEKPAGDNTVVFDKVVLELTDARIEQILKTYDATMAARAGRPALVDKLNKVQDARVKHMDKYGNEMQAVRQKRDEAEHCRNVGLEEMKSQKMKESSQKALSDPVLRDKYMKIAQQYNAAAASGDAAAVKSAQNAMLQVIMPTKDDTLEVYKKCPAVPGPLPSETKLGELDKEIASLSGELRKIDENVAEAQAEQGEMTSQQFGMATERIQMYLSWRQSKSYSKSATRGFTSKEIEAIEKYLEKLRAAMG